jgi:hypothetical protein
MTTKIKAPPKPTEAELGILNVLWERGPSTVRDVRDALYRDEDAGYTIALKLLQIMHAKGLVVRDDSERTHVLGLGALALIAICPVLTFTAVPHRQAVGTAFAGTATIGAPAKLVAAIAPVDGGLPAGNALKRTTNNVVRRKTLTTSRTRA